MSDRFTPVAGRLAGLAGRLLGWRPTEFWQATPAELAAILRPVSGPAGEALSRGELDRMMEHDDD